MLSARKELAMEVGIPLDKRTYLDFLREADYRIAGVLGRGENTGFMIHLAQRNGLNWAVKGSCESRQEGTLMLSLLKEYQILKSLSHPNIVTAFEFVQGESTNHFKGAGIIMEVCSGTPLQRMLPWSHPNFELAARCDVMHCILSALDYIHSRGIMHRDMHSKNVIVGNGLRRSVKLIDFNSAVRLEDNAIDDLQDDFNAALLPMGASEPSDEYAFGLLAAGLICGRECTTWTVFRYHAQTDSDWDDESVKLDLPKPGMEHALSAEATSFISGLLAQDARQRMTFQDALLNIPDSSSWLVQAPGRSRRISRISL